MTLKKPQDQEDDLRAEIKDVREQMDRIQALLEQQAAQQSKTTSTASNEEADEASGLTDAVQCMREYLEGLGVHTDVIDKVRDDIHHHPVRSLAIAAGIGWIIGRIGGWSR